MRDVILFTGPDINSVPRQAKRVWLVENGFVMSCFQLQKGWLECVVEACLREVGVDLEIFMPVHSTLVKPTIAPGQVLNGVMVHRIFKEKPIFLRPFEEIYDVCSSSVKRSREASQENDLVAKSPKVTTPEDFDILLIDRKFNET